MRVVLIGKGNVSSLGPLEALAAAHEIVGLVESAPRHAAPGGALRRTASALKRRLSRPGPLEARARTSGAAFLRLERGRVGALDDLLRSVRPDLLVVASLSQLLPEATIALPRRGAINVHPSLLPKFPGPFPILWQYLEDERRFGVTVHAIDAREDHGDILEQEPFDVPRGARLDDVIATSAAIGARLLVKAVNDLEAGRSAPRPQEGARVPRARAVRRNEPLVDWDRWPIERVWHVLGGTYPWLDPLREAPAELPAWRVGAYERGPSPGPAGHAARDGGGWYAAHPEGKIRLERRERAG